MKNANNVKCQKMLTIQRISLYTWTIIDPSNGQLV